MPAVDVGRSVSRVGGKTQLPAYQAVAGDLRLSYTQFMELETFARFGTRLDEETERTLRRGRHIREVLQQPQYEPIPVPEQIAVLLAVSEGVFDRLPLERMAEVEEAVRNRVTEELPDLSVRLSRGEPFEEAQRKKMLDVACSAISFIQEKNEHGDA
jgi:F-type H+/Na+-transporting ATPase subunit alpha